MPDLNSDYLTSDQIAEIGFASFASTARLHATCVIVGAANISVGAGARIDPFTCLVAVDGHLTIGRNTHVGAYSYLSANGGIVIEDFGNLSQGVRVYTRSDDYSGATLTNPTVPFELTGLTEGPVRIGAHCIIGSGSVVMPDCILGDGVAVGALSFVNESLPPWGIYAGVPTRRLRDRRRDLLELVDRVDERE